MVTLNHKLLLASAVLVVSAMCLDSIVGTNMSMMSMIATRQGTSNTFDISLSFTAIDEDGTAIPGATLYCSDSSGGTYSKVATTDSQGKYSSSNFLVSTVSPAECPKKEVTRYCYAQKGDIKTNTVSSTAELTCYVAPTATPSPTLTPTATSTSTPTVAPTSTSTATSYRVGDCVNLVGSIRKIIRISGDIYIYNSWWGTGWTGTEDGSFRISEIPSSIVSCPGSSTPTPTPTARSCSGGTCQDVIQDCSSGTCYKKACMSPTVTGNTACSRLGLACLSSDCSGGCTDVPVRDCECRAKCVPMSTPTPTPTPSCTDSDGGIVYNVWGTCNYPSGSGNDYCSGGTPGTLVEFYCSSPTATSCSASVYSCPYGCASGICKAAPSPTPTPTPTPTPALVCSDSDSVNTAVKGTCTDSSGSHTDECVDSIHVREYWCSTSNTCASIPYTCATGKTCLNGECR